MEKEEVRNGPRRSLKRRPNIRAINSASKKFWPN